MNNVVPFNDIERMGSVIVKSGLFGIRSAEQAISLMLIAQAEGTHPAAAARDYHVIQGRPALKADAMLARFQSAGGKVNWDSYTDVRVAATFSHPAGGSVQIEWTMERARQAGLGGKDVWKQYPRQMLRARVISEGIRTVFPGVAVGIYTPEEVQDFDRPAERPEPIEAQVLVSEEQVATLDALIGDVGANRSAFLKYMKVEALSDLPASRYDAAVKALESKRGR